MSSNDEAESRNITEALAKIMVYECLKYALFGPSSLCKDSTFIFGGALRTELLRSVARKSTPFGKDAFLVANDVDIFISGKDQYSAFIETIKMAGLWFTLSEDVSSFVSTSHLPKGCTLVTGIIESKNNPSVNVKVDLVQYDGDDSDVFPPFNRGDMECNCLVYGKDGLTVSKRVSLASSPLTLADVISDIEYRIARVVFPFDDVEKLSAAIFRGESDYRNFYSQEKILDRLLDLTLLFARIKKMWETGWKIICHGRYVRSMALCDLMVIPFASFSDMCSCVVGRRIYHTKPQDKVPSSGVEGKLEESSSCVVQVETCLKVLLDLALTRNDGVHCLSQGFKRLEKFVMPKDTAAKLVQRKRRIVSSIGNQQTSCGTHGDAPVPASADAQEGKSGTFVKISLPSRSLV